MSSLTNVNESGFKEMVLESNVPVLVDFWAEWCGPCRMVAPILEKLQKEFEGKISIVKIDLDANSNFSGIYGIQSIPTLIVFNNGKEVSRIVGAQGEARFKQEIEKVLQP